MRNWNTQAVIRGESPDIVFTVPMRNWNVIITPAPDFWNHRFYSTYEELKHISHKITPANNSSFYSTYEELKLVRSLVFKGVAIQFLQYLWGIETLSLLVHIYM